MSLEKHPIRVNHIGYMTFAKKRFILTENKEKSLNFTVDLIIDARFEEVLKGTLEECDDGYGNTVWVGDFSSVTNNGSYVIRAGGYKSRAFTVYDKAYDNTARIMLSYFTYQRCGSELGYHGKCHLDDGYIKETGEHVDLSGGYHQSCDLRKSPAGISIGVYGMIQYALSNKSEWGKKLLSDEVEWACDYYVKSIQENGDMYNTLNAPFGWEGRTFYKSPAPSSAAWNVVSCLSMAALYFKENKPDKSEQYLKTAIRAYNRLTFDQRSDKMYTHPDPHPLGMDPSYFYYYNCRKNSVSDIAQRGVASAHLWRITGDEKYMKEVERSAIFVADNTLKGSLAHCINAGDRHLVEGVSSYYSWMCGGLLVLVEACNIGISTPYIKEKIVAAAESICKIADTNIWKNTKMIYSDADLDIETGHVRKGEKAPRKRDGLPSVDSIGDTENELKCYYSHKTLAQRPSFAAYHGIILIKAFELTNNKKYMEYAQAAIDNLMGVNNSDSTNIVGQGYNHPNNPVSGQFFPHTPDIPGAVTIGYNDLDTTGLESAGPEYDMPCVGMMLYLISKISENHKYIDK